MNPSLLGTLFARLGRRAGVHANPHRFRHTFATWAIENQARELDVQYLLGHSTSAMVRRYAATYAAAKAAAAHSAFSPAARLIEMTRPSRDRLHHRGWVRQVASSVRIAAGPPGVRWPIALDGGISRKLRSPILAFSKRGETRGNDDSA